MNNKGQALVAFVLLLPIVFLLFAIIFDLGSLEISKQKYESEVKDTIKYGLNHLNDKNLNETLKTMLDINVQGNSKIEISENKISINIQTKYKSIFPNILKKDYDINITYHGYKENNKIKIKKD